MEDLRYGNGHFCAGCPRSKTLHKPNSCIVNQPLTDAELAQQGLKRVRGRHGREHIIYITNHTLCQTFAYGMIGLLKQINLSFAEKVAEIYSSKH